MRIEQIWKTLMIDALPIEAHRPVPLGSAPISRNGYRPATTMPPAIDSTGRRWPAGTVRWLAVAALLLLAAGAAGYQYFGPGFFRAQRPNTVPAAVVNATPSVAASPTPVVHEESLIDITIPGSALPAGIAGSALSVYTLNPGLHTTWTTPSLAMLNVVIDGELTVKPVNQMQLKRADSQTWQVSPGGTEVTLGPGDEMLVLNPVDADYTNLGPEIVRFIGWGTSAGNGSEPPFPSEWFPEIYDLSGAGAVTFTGSDVRLRLIRVDLEHGAAISSQATPLLQLVVHLTNNSAGNPQSPTLARMPDGSITNYGAQATIYVIRLDPIGPPASPIAGEASPVPISGSPTPER
jgi:hypothetical protein